MGEQATISGRGGSVVGVASNRALVRPQNDFHYALSQGNAYSWSNLTYDYDQHDTVLAVENNSAVWDFYIERIYLACDTLGEFTVFTTSGVVMTSVTTEPIGLNLNRNSGNVAPATAKTDETGQTEQGGGYPGRLLTGRLAVNIGEMIKVGGAIVLPLDHMIGIDSNVNGTAFVATIWGYFK